MFHFITILFVLASIVSLSVGQDIYYPCAGSATPYITEEHFQKLMSNFTGTAQQKIIALKEFSLGYKKIFRDDMAVKISNALAFSDAKYEGSEILKQRTCLGAEGGSEYLETFMLTEQKMQVLKNYVDWFGFHDSVYQRPEGRTNLLKKFSGSALEEAKKVVYGPHRGCSCY